MVEVLFGESEAAFMKFVKSDSHIIGGSKGEASNIGELPILDEREAEFITGNKDQVICLGFMLDIGNIRDSVDSQYRQDLIFSMYTQNEWRNSQEILNELKEAGKMYAAELNRLIDFVKKGEPIRIWYSNAPYSLCGFYFVCNFLGNILKEVLNEVYIVKLPEYVKTGEDSITEYYKWGEVPPEKFKEFLVYEKKLTLFEIRMFSHKWAELVEDNSPLRAVVNGQLIGVPEDFYDYLICKYITSKPVKEARVIGDILGHYPLGIGDFWYASRIELMIKSGSIKVIEDSEMKYARTICSI